MYLKVIGYYINKVKNIRISKKENNMKRLSIMIISILLLIMALPVAAKEAFPEVILLPESFRPEGIAIGNSHAFFTGSLGDGTIWTGDLRTGEGQELVPGQAGQMAVGMSFDARSGFLFVAGGLNGVGRVYDTGSGTLLAEYPMFSGGMFGDFINDVIVTRQAAYFTNSFAAFIYRVPLDAEGQLPVDPALVEAIHLTGDWMQVPGSFVFNANGIEATPNGKTLIVVSSAAEAVYLVNPENGEATQIDLGEAVPNGDGLVLLGKTMYVVQNQQNQIGVITLSPDLSAGVVGEPITNTLFDIPTTAAAFGNSLYAVNAKFGTPPAGTIYEIIKVSQK
jgi:hypothetical protein